MIKLWHWLEDMGSLGEVIVIAAIIGTLWVSLALWSLYYREWLI